MPKRFVSYEGQTIELTLGTSDRVTHRLVTHVFKIFLREVLGYPDVRIVEAREPNVFAAFDSLSQYFQYVINF